MEPAIDPATIPQLPRPLTVAQHAVVTLWERTGLMASKYQLNMALALAAGCDVLCIAGTGCGKSIAFILVLFMCPEIILWILSPLNYIKNQMAERYREIGLNAVSVNTSTLTPQLLKDIMRGTYRVVISSPEAYHDSDSNKLRPVLLSKDRAHRVHLTVVDEAHCNTTWGETGFHKIFQCIGDIRVFMPNPDNSPMCAATATCSAPVKDAILQSLHFKDDYLYINLGNWGANLCHGLHVMNDGQKPYSEVNFFFNLTAQPFQDLPQSMVFVESCTAAHYIAFALREHFGLRDVAARMGIAVYHSLVDDPTKRHIEDNFKRGRIRILVTTEALTMGADFPNAQIVLTFLATQTLGAWVQHGGGAGRSALEEMCPCIMLATKKMVLNTCQACKDTGIPVDPTLASIKAEADNEEDEDVPDMRPIDPVPEANPSSQGRQLTKYERPQPQVSLGVAEYVATIDSRTAVPDREFNNPPHPLCYDTGGCDRCVEHRRRDDDVDLHAQRCQLLKEEDEERRVEDEHKKPAYQRNANLRYGDLRAKFTNALMAWRKDKFLELIELYDISLDCIMTQKELTAIAKTKGIEDLSAFDQAATYWPGPPEWRLEVLDRLQQVQQEEDERIAEEVARKQEAQRKAEEKAECEQQAGAAKTELERC